MRTEILPPVRAEHAPDLPSLTFDDVCLALVRLSDRDRAYFRGCPLPAIPVPQHSRCRLPAFHAGPHLADAVYSSLELIGWIQWGGLRVRRRRTFHAPICRDHPDRQWISFGVSERCRLPRAHRGPHTFDYYPGLDVAFATQSWLLENPWPHED